MLKSSFYKSLFLIISCLFYGCTEPCITIPNNAYRGSDIAINHDNNPREDLRKYTGKLDMIQGEEFSDKNILVLNTWIDSLLNVDNDFKFIHIKHFSCKNSINKDEKYKQLVHKRMDQYEKLISQINSEKNRYPITLILKSYHPCESDDKIDYLEISVRELKKPYQKPVTPDGYMIETAFQRDLVTDTIIEAYVTVDSLTTFLLKKKGPVKD